MDEFSPECDCPPRVGGACFEHAAEQYRAEAERLQHELAMAQDALKIAGDALGIGLAAVERLRERCETAAQFVEAARRRGSIGPTSAQVLLGYLRDASAATTGEDRQ